MPSGNNCYNLGPDKCAQITGSGNSTSTMGVPNMGTTFIQTVNISDLNIKNGGQTKYSIKVDKQDAQDSIYMHITGKDGNTNVFSGTDILSASGTNSGYQTYENGFDFSGSITTIIIEVGGRDVFDSNNVVETDNGIDFEPIELQEPSYESVEIEIQEIEIAEIEVEVIEMEMQVEAEIEVEIEESVEETIEVETDTSKEEAPKQETKPEKEQEENDTEVKTVEKQDNKEQEPTEQEEEETEETKTVEKKETSKEKAVKKIMKKIDDKKRYDDIAQTKTLVVMQVLGNTKTFFDTQKILNDRVDFFTNVTLPDAEINDNNIASYFLFAGSDGLHSEMVDSQWQMDLE
jgi:hypothetical protein